MKYDIQIPTTVGEPLTLSLASGHSVIIIGANGSGKTRLGAHLDLMTLPQRGEPLPVHRIPAHKSLEMSDEVTLISFDRAAKMLSFGSDNGGHGHKHGHRWHGKAPVLLLNDFLVLQQILFAENNRISVQHVQDRKIAPDIPVPITSLHRLKTIWDSLLPHRALKILDASIAVLPSTAPAGAASYAGSQMSDGERAIFYFLGQCLMTPKETIVVVDEPESHVHKAVLGPLWDAIERARPDCAFIYITHDLDFAASRPAAAKYFIRSYVHEPQAWDIAEVPRDTGLPENVVAEIVGSRKPILFVEGERGSLDVTLYRHHYNGFTIMPIGGCDAVIHSVASYNASPALHRLDAKGLVDADHRPASEVTLLADLSVQILPVAEVENLLLLPEMFKTLAEALALDPAQSLDALKSRVFAVAASQVEQVCTRYTSRQLQARLGRVAKAANTLAALQASYQHEIGQIDPAAIFAEFKAAFEKAINDKDLELVLKLFDNKTIVSIAAGVLGLRDRPQGLMERVERLLGDESQGVKLRAALAAYLPVIAVPAVPAAQGVTAQPMTQPSRPK